MSEITHEDERADFYAKLKQMITDQGETIVLLTSILYQKDQLNEDQVARLLDIPADDVHLVVDTIMRNSAQNLPLGHVNVDTDTLTPVDG